MSNRFHNKFHRQNHHSKSTPNFPDSSYDPIASYAAPFQGEFYSQGDILTTENLSAVKDIFATNGTLYNNLSVGYDALVKNNLTVENNAFVDDNLTVGNDVQIDNNLNVSNNATIQNNLTVFGNLSTLGTVTQLDTLVYVTSALSVTNSGTGPAATITQTGSEDVAVFRDDINTALIIKDGGNVGINTATPSEKLDVNGNARVQGNTTVTGNISATGTATIQTINTGLTNDVVTKSSNNTLETRLINSQIWDTTAKFVSASDGNLTTNFLTKATNGNGINESIVFDNGINVGIGTSSPNSKLTVVDDNVNALRISNNTDHEYYASFGCTLSAGYFTAGSAFARDVPLIFRTSLNGDEEEKVRITANGNVGINETSPEAKLHVKNSSAGTVTAHPSSVGVFESEGHAYISLLAPDNHSSGIVMGGPGDNYAAYINWNHDNGDLKVATSHPGADMHFLVGNEVDAVRIASNGNVGVGTTSPNEKLTVSGNISAGNALFLTNAYLSSTSGTMAFNLTNSLTSVSLMVLGDEKMRVWQQGHLALDDFNNLPTSSGNPTYKFMHFASPTDGGSTALSMASKNTQTCFYGNLSGQQFVIGTEGSGTINFKNNLVYSNSDVLASGNSLMLIASNGNVGVGTTSPNEKLTVVGNISATGNIAAQSSTIPVSVTSITTNKTFSDSDTNKVFHLSGSSPLSAIFPSSLSDGFNVALMNTGTSTLHLSTNSPYKAVSNVLTDQYAGAYVYKANSEIFAVGGF